MPDLRPDRAEDPQRGAVRIRSRDQQERARFRARRHGEPPEVPGAGAASTSTTTPCSQQTPWGAAARWTMPPELEENQRRRAEREVHRGNVRPARHRVEEAAVLTHVRLRPQRPTTESLRRRRCRRRSGRDGDLVLPGRARRPPRPGGRRGTWHRSPAMLSTHIVPPWASTMRREMYSPRPFPPAFGSACQPRSKTRVSSAGKSLSRVTHPEHGPGCRRPRRPHRDATSRRGELHRVVQAD